MTATTYVIIGYLVAVVTWAVLIWWSGRRAGQP